jgi:hypothetical protein
MAIGDHISLVPRDSDNNLEFREKMCKKGCESRTQAAALRGMCRQDVLFFINTFCWTANPMWHPNCPERPFLTWPFQEHAIRRMAWSLAHAGKPQYIGRTDLVFYKARGTGGTWVALLFALWRWLFFRSQSFLLVSRKKEFVDKAKDLNALMPKLDFALERLPRWLRPRLGSNDRIELKLYNPMTHSIFNGETTTGEFARGGRPTAIIPDEFGFFDLAESFKALKAATGASFCCWFISTTNGVGNAFHKIVTDGEMEVVDFKWEDMPPKRAGLYRSVEGKVEYLDEGYEYPPGYEFIDDGKLRSVWYDATERRTKMRSLMAQEHDRDFVGSGDPFWAPEELEPLMAKTRPPTSVNYYTSDNGSKGKLRLWLPVRASKSPPLDRCYVVGVDVSAGTGASNSCLSVLDCRLNEKVGELADPNLDPTELAEIAAQVGRWFQDWTGTPALVIWEANGPVGAAFGKRMLALEYENLYYSLGGLTADEKKSHVPGLWVVGQTPQSLIRDYGVALTRGDFVEPSEEGIKECYDFRYFPNGKVMHYKAASSEDASGARDNHGDRVAANAVALRGAAGISEPVPDAGGMLESGGHLGLEPSYPCEYTEMQEHRRAKREAREIEEGWLTR